MRKLILPILLVLASLGLGAAPASAHVVSPGGSICEASDPPAFDHYLIVHAHHVGNWGCFSWNRVSGSGRRECFWVADSNGPIGGYSCGHDVW